MALFYSGALMGLYLLAEDLAWEHTYNKIRCWSRVGFLLLVILYLFGFTWNDLSFHLVGHWLFNPTRINVRVVAHLLAFAIPIGMLVTRYRRVRASDRARICWVLVSVTGIVAAYLVYSDFGITRFSGIESDILFDVFAAASIIGFVYAVLHYRLVALHVVLNRALVFAIAITILVAAFGLLESLIEHEALGDKASALVALAVPLVLGIFFDQMHQLAIDDPACVRLRANLTETKLDDLGSALGTDGLVSPVALRGVLIGVLVLVSQPGNCTHLGSGSYYCT